MAMRPRSNNNTAAIILSAMSIADVSLFPLSSNTFVIISETIIGDSLSHIWYLSGDPLRAQVTPYN